MQTALPAMLVALLVGRLGGMNRKNVKMIIILLAVVDVEAAFGYAYLCGALTVTYGLSLPSADLTHAEFEQVLYLSRLQ
ncbi:hypothetical protein [Shewanella xiamenensis]|uniref:hypothetical protein n=1 Tax=Shewanella xiamenensis TaxID=332186 RepID=UPI001184DA57|nr:hypothetical protein [Shewanella xiamenensis]TVL29639.1 hypothetical protein AYI95_15180 [Shewanella xiamenensis]